MNSTSASTTRLPSEADDPHLTLNGQNFTDTIHEKPAKLIENLVLSTLSTNSSMPSDDGDVFGATASSIIEMSTDNVTTIINSNKLIEKNFEQQDKRTSYCESYLLKQI